MTSHSGREKRILIVGGGGFVGRHLGELLAARGVDFGVVSRVPAVGGQVVTLQGLRGRYDEVFLPLFGAHQAQNAAVALAAVEAFAGESALDDELVRTARSGALRS